MLAQKHLEHLVCLEGFHANDAHLSRGDEHHVVWPAWPAGSGSKLAQEAVLPDLLPNSTIQSITGRVQRSRVSQHIEVQKKQRERKAKEHR